MSVLQTVIEMEPSLLEVILNSAAFGLLVVTVVAVLYSVGVVAALLAMGFQWLFGERE